ncbi:MAG: hypothetical protein QW567_03265 [Candidatus Hadarchaeales archaeon]
MESIPVVLMLGAVAAVFTLGVMASGLGLAERTNDRGAAVQGFRTFVNRVALLCSGGEGSSIACNLDVGDGMVEVDGRRLRLLLDGEELRSDLVPVPFEPSVRELRNGAYVLTLVRSAGEERIRVEAYGGGKR